jgi:hypothetical protein
MKVELTGNTVKVYANNNLVLTYSSLSVSKGYVGFGSNGAQGSFDNVAVTQGSGTTGLTPLNAFDNTGQWDVTAFRSGSSVILYWQLPRTADPQVFNLQGRMLHAENRDDQRMVISGPADGVYFFRQGKAMGKLTIAGRMVNLDLDEKRTAPVIRSSYKAAAGDKLTLVFTKDGFRPKEVESSLAATGVNVELDSLLAGGKPWEHNTGPTNTSILVTKSSISASTPGQVIENVRTSYIGISANNVTIRNFEMDCNGGHYGIKIEPGLSGIVIEDGEIFNIGSCAILGMGFTARRLYIHDAQGDGIKAQGSGGPVLVEACFIEKLGKGDGAHADGNQTRGATATITFRQNNIWMPVSGTPNYPGAPYKSNATFMLQLDIKEFIIEDNWLNGGNYTIYGTSTTKVINNRIGRDYRYGVQNGGSWSGNVWEDTGLPCP